MFSKFLLILPNSYVGDCDLELLFFLFFFFWLKLATTCLSLNCLFHFVSHRDFEPIRLLGLQFLGRLLVGLPSEKKGPKFFNLAVGRSKSLSESQRKINLRMQPVFFAISERLFRFSLTDNLCATLFDVLLGGASPKQVIGFM